MLVWSQRIWLKPRAGKIAMHTVHERNCIRYRLATSSNVPDIWLTKKGLKKHLHGYAYNVLKPK
jgi:hypothetical protein